MKTHWKEYFIFSEKELKAVIVIGSFVIASIVLAILFPSKKQSSTLFYFDPNTIDSLSAMKLGIQPKQFTILANFRKRGGKFYTKMDLFKWFGVSPKTIKQLLPYVRIKKVENSHWVKGQNQLLIDLNKVGIKELLSVGLSYALSVRVIRYRTFLGGYDYNSQLKKVYGMSDSMYQTILPNLKKLPGLKPKMHWNTMNYEQIASLQIFEKREIWDILKKRKEQGAAMDWAKIVTQYDLSRKQSNVLKNRTDIR